MSILAHTAVPRGSLSAYVKLDMMLDDSFWVIEDGFNKLPISFSPQIDSK